MFSHAAPSRYVIIQQPEPGCLSTLEATHELLLVLDRSGLDQYEFPEQLLSLFQRMQTCSSGAWRKTSAREFVGTRSLPQRETRR